MTEAAIQKIVCMAVVSGRFRSQLLGEERPAVLRSFGGLDAREQEALMGIQAGTIEEFAAGVERLVHGWRRTDIDPHSLKPVSIPGWIPIDSPPKRE
jgi:hypothetical protein